MVDDQSPSGESGISGLIETIKQRPGLYGGVAAVVLVAIVAIVILAMGGGDEDPAAEVAPPPTTTGAGAAPTVTIPDDDTTSDNAPVAGIDDGASSAPPVTRNPLTGVTLDAASSDRVVAVKVDNSTEAGPPIGIQDAELIIETPVEGGLTRLTAMFFENEPQVVGPVRSVRPVDADLMAPWKPFLVSTGGQSFVNRELVAAGVELLEEGTEGVFFQQIERRQPYHLVATIPLVVSEAGEGAPPVEVLPFGDTPLGGSTAASVQIPFSGVAEVEWRYESGDDTYVRRVNGDDYQVFPQYDADLTGFATDTVIVMMAAQRSAGYTDPAGADVPTFDVIGFGDLMVFHGGEVMTGQWLRSAQSDGWVFLDDTGAQFTVPAGKVWLEIVPRFVDVAIQ